MSETRPLPWRSLQGKIIRGLGGLYRGCVTSCVRSAEPTDCCVNRSPSATVRPLPRKRWHGARRASPCTQREGSALPGHCRLPGQCLSTDESKLPASFAELGLPRRQNVAGFSCEGVGHTLVLFCQLFLISLLSGYTLELHSLAYLPSGG